MKSNARSKPKEINAPQGLDFASKALLIGVPTTIFVIIAILLHFVTSSRQRLSVARTVDRWKTTYQISERDVGSIRAIELDFHGSGSVFSSSTRRSEEEVVEHHKKISEFLPPQFQEKFLADMKTSRHKH